MKKIYSLLFVSLIAISGLTLINCGVADVEQGDPNSYLEIKDVTVEHIVGSDPCPQNVGDVYVSKSGNSGNITTIDSVVVSAPHMSIDAEYVDGGDLEESYITIDFNCSKAESVNTVVEVQLYANGELVATENITVTVTVKD